LTVSPLAVKPLYSTSISCLETVMNASGSSSSQAVKRGPDSSNRADDARIIMYLKSIVILILS